LIGPIFEGSFPEFYPPYNEKFKRLVGVDEV